MGSWEKIVTEERQTTHSNQQSIVAKKREGNIKKSQTTCGMAGGYSVAVIGAGMIGSSAARWVAAQQISNAGRLQKGEESKIVLVGPGEEAWGAWSDDGRTTRVLEPSKSWRLLAENSVSRYRDLEKESGIPFFHEVGYLAIIGEERDRGPFLERAQVTRERGFVVDLLERKTLQSRFPHLNPPKGSWGLHLPKSGGHINPRALVAAQQKMASRSGCTFVRQSVSQVKREGGLFQIIFGHGQSLWAEKVILATGAATSVNSLVEDLTGRQISLSLAGQTVAFLRLSVKQAAALSYLPALSTFFRTKKLDGSYILPPIAHNDGQCYMKIGHHGTFEQPVGSQEQLEAWYRGGGNIEAVSVLADFLANLIPTLSLEGVQGGSCVTANTESKDAPYIQEVLPGLVIAAGGCGQAAKCCDEIGRLAAVLSSEGRWDSEVEQGDAKVQWKEV